VPVGAWLASGWDPLAGRSPRIGAGFFARRLAEHRDGRADHRLYLYAHALLAGWQAAREESR